MSQPAFANPPTGDHKQQEKRPLKIFPIAVEPFVLARIHIADGPFPPSIPPCSPARSAPLEPSTPEGFFFAGEFQKAEGRKSLGRQLPHGLFRGIIIAQYPLHILHLPTPGRTKWKVHPYVSGPSRTVRPRASPSLPERISARKNPHSRQPSRRTGVPLQPRHDRKWQKPRRHAAGRTRKNYRRPPKRALARRAGH